MLSEVAMARKLVIVALLSLGASAFNGFLSGALAAEMDVDRSQLQLQLRPSRPAVVGRAVAEPLSKRSVVYQMKARTYLRSRLSRVFPTIDTPHGLIVNIPASLLSSGSGLSRDMTHKLAQVAEAFPPDVDVRVEGYTDDRGSRAQTLRASSGLAEIVRNVLEQNDNSPREIAVSGFVSNTSSKLHERRCVQIVITGRGIGQGIVMARTTPVARHSAVNRGKRMLALNKMPRATGR